MMMMMMMMTTTTSTMTTTRKENLKGNSEQIFAKVNVFQSDMIDFADKCLSRRNNDPCTHEIFSTTLESRTGQAVLEFS